MMITEFLLARIAEDEARCGPENDIGLAYCDADEGDHYSATRVLAECEAKRRIAEDFRWIEDPTVVVDGRDPLRCTEGFVLKSLAAVYADHPDYREEWRPSAT